MNEISCYMLMPRRHKDFQSFSAAADTAPFDAFKKSVNVFNIKYIK
jgi:hypothetical protein